MSTRYRLQSWSAYPSCVVIHKDLHKDSPSATLLHRYSLPNTCSSDLSPTTELGVAAAKTLVGGYMGSWTLSWREVDCLALVFRHIDCRCDCEFVAVGGNGNFLLSFHVDVEGDSPLLEREVVAEIDVGDCNLWNLLLEYIQVDSWISFHSLTIY